MLTEQIHPDTRKIDQLPTLEMLQLINREDARVSDAVAAVLAPISRVVDTIVERMQARGRLFYVGAGTSGRLGVLDAVECPPTFGTHPGLVQALLAGGAAAATQAVETAEDDAGQGILAVEKAGVDGRDAVVGLSASGRTPYTIGAVRKASDLGAFTASVSCNKGSPISEFVDVPIEVLCGPEVVAGSTRMKSGTAQKLVLNMISTGTMIRLGHVYGNLMVNVNLSNSKLIARGIRIVAEAAHTGLDEAEQALKKAGDVRSAIVMIALKCSADEARGLVSQSARLNEILSGPLRGKF